MRGIVSVEIRPEQAGDEAAIYKVTADAFRGRPYAGGDEQDLLNRLRELGQLALSLVAMDGDQLVGQITFSPVTLSDGSEPWFGLGPVSVTPECQSQGIGSQLIRSGLDEISARGARAHWQSSVLPTLWFRVGAEECAQGRVSRVLPTQALECDEG